MKAPVLISERARTSGHGDELPLNINSLSAASVTQLATTGLLPPWLACTASMETWVSQSMAPDLESCTAT